MDGKKLKGQLFFFTNSVLVTTQLTFSKRRIIKLIAIRSGLGEEFLCNPSTKIVAMNLSESSSICAEAAFEMTLCPSIFA